MKRTYWIGKITWKLLFVLIYGNVEQHMVTLIKLHLFLRLKGFVRE